MPNPNDYEKILYEVVQKAEGDFVLILVIAFLMMIGCLVPFYVMLFRDRKNRRLQEITLKEKEMEMTTERQKQSIEMQKLILDVVTANTQVNSATRTAIETSFSEVFRTLIRIEGKLNDKTT